MIVMNQYVKSNILSDILYDTHLTQTIQINHYIQILRICRNNIQIISLDSGPPFSPPTRTSLLQNK